MLTWDGDFIFINKFIKHISKYQVKLDKKQ